MIRYTNTKTPMPELAPEVRVNTFEESATGYTEQMAVREAMRCLRCRKHPCMANGCPVHNNIPEFIAKVAEADFEAAYQVLAQTTTLPAVCGRVCPQYEQCEGSCVRGIKGQAVSIGALERFVADWHRKNAPAEAPKADDQARGLISKAIDRIVTDLHKKQEAYKADRKVAVIGSGPAGIACASVLADKGFPVTIFEKEEVAGGVLSYGIPQFRLPKDIVSAQIDDLKAKGVEIKTGVAFGGELTADSLKEEGYSAVFVGNGAGVPYTMGIPGEDLENVCVASDYLVRINLDKAYCPNSANPLPKAEKIAIVGGGNVAMDACRCAARTGAKKVYVVYRRSEAEMPADPAEVKEAIEEGVEFMYLTNPVAVKGDGKVSGLECVRMELGEPDASGRRRPIPIEGSNFILDVDYVIMAIGTGFDEAVTSAAGGAELNRKGAFVVDPETQASSVPGIYAGGDNVTGPKTVVAAMVAGQKAGEAIAQYLA